MTVGLKIFMEFLGPDASAGEQINDGAAFVLLQGGGEILKHVVWEA
jgi:hypothetical protein